MPTDPRSDCSLREPRLPKPLDETTARGHAHSLARDMDLGAALPSADRIYETVVSSMAT